MRAVVREALETLVLALLLFWGLQISLQPTQVQGASMYPTLASGQRLLVNKLVYLHFSPSSIVEVLPFIESNDGDDVFVFHTPERGEVIIFHFPPDPSRDFVKRVIGLPGDTVEIKRGDVYIDGELLNEPYIERRDRSNTEPTTIPEGEIFVLGDNRRASDDSRQWGNVPLENVVGKGWFTYWPVSDWILL